MLSGGNPIHWNQTSQIWPLTIPTLLNSHIHAYKHLGCNVCRKRWGTSPHGWYYGVVKDSFLEPWHLIDCRHWVLKVNFLFLSSSYRCLYVNLSANSFYGSKAIFRYSVSPIQLVGFLGQFNIIGFSFGCLAACTCAYFENAKRIFSVYVNITVNWETKYKSQNICQLMGVGIWYKLSLKQNRCSIWMILYHCYIGVQKWV